MTARLRTKNLPPQSLDNLTRGDIARLCDRYWQKDRAFLRRALRQVFGRPSNIHLFGWFINKKYVELETPDFHREILAMISNDENRRIGIAAPRGHAKSTTVNFTYALWASVYGQVRFGVIISDTISQSIEFVNALKSEFEDNAILRWLYGDFVNEKEWRDGEFVLKSGVKWVAKGAGMKIRGIRYRATRPDLLIFDDLENDERVSTAFQRKKLKNWLLRAALPALSRDGRAVLIGTVLHHDSLLQNILQQKDAFGGWQVKMYRAIETDEGGGERALWPEHKNLETLKRMRDDATFGEYVGSLAFAQEYQNTPLAENDLIIKPEHIRWAEKIEETAQIRKTVIAIDPAVSQRETADPTGKVVASLDDVGRIWVRYVGNERLSPNQNAEDIKRLSQRFDPQFIGIESGALGLVFQEMLVGLPLVGLKPNADKVSRLVAVSRFFEAGKVYFLNGANKINELHDQLMEFPSGAHDDMVDALGYAVQMLLGQNRQIADDDFKTFGDYQEDADEIY